MVPDTQHALEALLRGDLGSWHGLPDCGPAELSAVFRGTVQPAGRGLLSGVPTAFRMYQVAGMINEAWAWFDDADHCRLIWLIEPPWQRPVHLMLTTLGAPNDRLEPGIGPHSDAHQWIWARRGLTLFVREELDEAAEIARACAYRPTTVEDYLNNLGARDRTRYH
jgi:hypothetical protein